MHILFLTHYYPPEVNAPASRTYENARQWVDAGHRVTVMTGPPSHPHGKVYPGYANPWHRWDECDGIHVLRVKTYVSANKGFFKRIANYLSYMASATMQSWRVKNVDVVVSTSPQFFCGLAGFFMSRLKRKPWVLEIRDLWPESIIAVGAITNRRVIQFLEGVETFMYRRADHIVSLTRAFKQHITNRGVAPEKISIITNGADLRLFQPGPRDNSVRAEFDLGDRFVASFIGTHGMAHKLETVLQAADLLRNRGEIVFLLVGDGAERDNLLKMKQDMDLKNVLMVVQQPKERMPEFLAASDACMVLLRKTELFKTVIPSKIFEAMAMQRSIILGVEGESREIVEKGRCGLCVEPENARELAEAVVKLSEDKRLARELGRNGFMLVTRKYDRKVLAKMFLDLLKLVGQGKELHNGRKPDKAKES